MLNNLNEKLQTAYEYGNWTDVIKEADAKLDEELAKGKEEAKWGKITGTLADQTDLKTALDGLDTAIQGKSTVSGTDDGTNWTDITIDGVTKNIGGGTHKYLHNITVTSTTDTYIFTLIAVSDTSTKYTKTTLSSLLGTLAVNIKYFPCIGKIVIDGVEYQCQRIGGAQQGGQFHIEYTTSGSYSLADKRVNYNNIGTVSDFEVTQIS